MFLPGLYDGAQAEINPDEMEVLLVNTGLFLTNTCSGWLCTAYGLELSPQLMLDLQTAAVRGRMFPQFAELH